MEIFNHSMHKNIQINKVNNTRKIPRVPFRPGVYFSGREHAEDEAFTAAVVFSAFLKLLA